MTGMNPRVRGLWLRALESGDYAQAKSKLAWVDEFGDAFHCCLGVLCEVALRDGVPLTVTEAVVDVAGAPYRRYRRYDGADNFLPAAVVIWAGLDPDLVVSGGDVLVDGEDDGSTLSSLNDVGRDFGEIAAVIRDQL